MIFNRTVEGVGTALHPGQHQALGSKARFVIVLAGTQSGKTVFGPLWLLREITLRGAGDYMVVTPTYPLMEKKALPAFLDLFSRSMQLGVYRPGRRVFEFYPENFKALQIKDPGQGIQVFFGHASDPDSLESATAKAVWMDEAGQKRFQAGSWEAIQRRLSIYQGRALFTTTPYNLGWFKQQVCDRAGRDPDYDLIRFASDMNPSFPKMEYERARRTLPDWKFRMFYQAEFTRPAGLVYDCFDESRHIVEPFPIPEHWGRYAGLDFGGVHMAAVFIAQDPDDGKCYLYRSYQAGGRSADEHVAALLAGEPDTLLVVGGSPGEGQWRREFSRAGLYVYTPPISAIEVGIARVYAAHRAGRLMIFNDQAAYLDEKMRYARLLDQSGIPTEQIDDPHSFHLMDAERYVVSYLDHLGWAG